MLWICKWTRMKLFRNSKNKEQDLYYLFISVTNNNCLKCKEEFEDTRIRKSKDKQHNGQNKSTKGQTTTYKTLHSKLKIEQHEPHDNPEVFRKGKPFLLHQWYTLC
jgi:hypothetical protein